MFPGHSDAKEQSPSDNRLLVWTIQVARHVKEPHGWTEYEHREIDDLAFSPDDQRLAVTITHNGPSSGKNMHSGMHVLVVDLRSPETNVQQFDLSDTCARGLAWSPTGNGLVVCGTVLRLADGASCDATALPPIVREDSQQKAFWLDCEHVILSHDGEILDTACRHVDKWRLEPAWQIGAVAASKGWVLLEHTEKRHEDWLCEYSIVDRASHRALSGWPIQRCGARMMLAAGAEALCFNVEGGRLHCRAINGGKDIPVPKQARNYVMSQAATSSARVLIEKWEEYRIPWWEGVLIWWLPYPGGPPALHQRAVLDLHSGSWISSWKPRTQASMDHPYHCALSMSGEFLIESGDGALELYRLPR
jgi:hypothetical protein